PDPSQSDSPPNAESEETSSAESAEREKSPSVPPPSGRAATEESAPLDPLEAARAEAAKLKDMWMRTAADFDNFRKRTRREIEDAKKGGREDLLRTVLPVFDNLERAIQSGQRGTDVKAVADGLAMVLRNFTASPGRAGRRKV